MRENHCPIFVGEIEGKAGRFDARLAEVHRDKDAAWLIAKLGRNSEDRSLTDAHQAEGSLTAEQTRCHTVTSESHDDHRCIAFSCEGTDALSGIAGLERDWPAVIAAERHLVFHGSERVSS